MADSVSILSGFPGTYDVEHFIRSLRYDVKVVERLPEIDSRGKPRKIRSYQVRYHMVREWQMILCQPYHLLFFTCFYFSFDFMPK